MDIQIDSWTDSKAYNRQIKELQKKLKLMQFCDQIASSKTRGIEKKNIELGTFNCSKPT